jgi:hypothetical protein
MGYSGANPISYGEEVFSQNTFTPNYDKWVVNNDTTTIVDNIVYCDSTGYILQTYENFNTPPISGNIYKFECVLQNVVAGDIVCELYDEEGVIWAEFFPINGVNVVFFEYNGSDPETYPIYFYYLGSPDLGYRFEVTSMSLKKYENFPGESGYSGYNIEDVPTTCDQIIETTEEDLVTDFNALLTSLRETGWMEEEPTI